MIKNERFDQIIKILEKEKYSNADYLAKALYVSPATIRRDLKKLESNGLVSTCYGGVSLIQSDHRNVPLVVRENFNNNIKAQLAKTAALLIPDGSTVFLDASSTVSYIIDFLKPSQNITVITNGIKALSHAAHNHINAYSTGGRLIDNSLALAGSIALDNVSSMYADFVFFSSQGITNDGIITDQSEHETELRRAMIKNSRSKFFICDNSKIGKVFLFTVCTYKDVDKIICDKEIYFKKSEI